MRLSFPTPSIGMWRNCSTVAELAAHTKNIIIYTFCAVLKVIISHRSTVPIVGMGKERRTRTGPWRYLKRQHPLLELNCMVITYCKSKDQPG